MNKIFTILWKIEPLDVNHYITIYYTLFVSVDDKRMASLRRRKNSPIEAIEIEMASTGRAFWWNKQIFTSQVRVRLSLFQANLSDRYRSLGVYSPSEFIIPEFVRAKPPISWKERIELSLLAHFRILLTSFIRVLGKMAESMILFTDTSYTGTYQKFQASESFFTANLGLKYTRLFIRITYSRDDSEVAVLNSISYILK